MPRRTPDSDRGYDMIRRLDQITNFRVCLTPEHLPPIHTPRGNSTRPVNIVGGEWVVRSSRADERVINFRSVPIYGCNHVNSSDKFMSVGSTLTILTWVMNPYSILYSVQTRYYYYYYYYSVRDQMTATPY